MKTRSRTDVVAFLTNIQTRDQIETIFDTYTYLLLPRSPRARIVLRICI